jgi:hypothetical protein
MIFIENSGLNQLNLEEKVIILEKSYANRSKLSLFKVSMGLKAPFAHSWLRQCYTIIIEKMYQIM